MKSLITIICIAFMLAGCSTKRVEKEQQGGVVTLSFDVDEQGVPVNIKVLEAEPKDVLDSAAKAALSKWRYEPKRVNGVAVKQLGLTVTLDFRKSE